MQRWYRKGCFSKLIRYYLVAIIFTYRIYPFPLNFLFKFSYIIGEILAPLGLIVGLFTRTTSLIIAFTMLMSVYLVFGADAFMLTKFGAFKAELNLFFLFSCIAIYFLGAGKYALSEVVFKSNSRLKKL